MFVCVTWLALVGYLFGLIIVFLDELVAFVD